MAGVLKLEIKESSEQLGDLMQTQSDAVARSKIQVLWWLQTGQCHQVNQLVELSGYHRTTISRWLSSYREGGLARLLEVRVSTGRPRNLSDEVLADLQRELNEPEGFESYLEVQRWLLAVHGVEVPYSTVHSIVRYQLKSKLKRARPVSEYQDPEALEAFKKTLVPSSV